MPPNTQFMLFLIFIFIAFGFVGAIEFSHNTVLNTFLAIIALFVTLLAFLTKNYIYLFQPVLNKKGKNLVLNANEAFVLSPTKTAIIRVEGSNVYASSFIKIPMYRSATEMNDAEKLDLSKLFARILTISSNPIKLSSQLYVINNDEYISRLRDTLNRVEEKYRELQNTGGDMHSSEMERARGEVTMWRSLLDNVAKSYSEALVLYAMTTAMGSTEEEATNIVYQRAQELAGGVSTLLGVNAFVVTGDEILDFIEPDYMIPVSTVSERIRKKTVGE